MAFGYRRAPGSSRGYINESDPDGPVPIGGRISRRQFDKRVGQIGKRQSLPGAEAIREALHNLERTAAILDQRAQDLVGEREQLSREQQRLALEQEELDLEKQLFRRARQDAGQRRYNAVLDLYVKEQRRQGNRGLTKTQARKSEQFKAIMRDIKGKSNPTGNANIKDTNRFQRQKALDQLGGSNRFREQYEQMYGTSRPRAQPGDRIRVRVGGTYSMRLRVRRNVA